MQWRWADSSYLFWLPVIPFLYGLFWYLGQKKFKALQKAVGAKVMPFLLGGVSLKKRAWKLILASMALVPLILALARPQFGESKENIKSLGIELMILFDVSQSMLAEDMAPSRLEFAKKEVGRLLEKMPGNKVGLVAFAGSAALISPITTDSSALKMFVESLTTEAISTQGTEFKMALEQADEAFRRGGQSEDPSAKVTRVILIVSDGEDQEPGAVEVAEKLTQQGLRIFTVAVGTEKGGTIPLRDSNGFLRGYKKDAEGQPVVTTSKGDALKSLALAGQGSFYTASFGGKYLDELIEDFNKLDKTEFDTQTLMNFQERYQLFLLIAIGFLMVELWLTLRRPAKDEWRGRFQAEGP